MEVIFTEHAKRRMKKKDNEQEIKDAIKYPEKHPSKEGYSMLKRTFKEQTLKLYTKKWIVI